MVCLTCKKFYRPEKNGVLIEEMMPQGPRDNPTWVPYKLWMADKYKCPSCGTEAIGGFSLAGPIGEHFHENYASVKKMLEETYGPALQISDCGPTHLGWRPDDNVNTLRLFVSKGGILSDQLADMEDEMRQLRDAAERLLKKVESV